MRTLCALLVVVCVSEAIAQPADALPAASPDRIAVGGEVTATYGSEDPGFFNYATYAYDPLRNVRMVFDASLRPLRSVEVLAQVRTDNTSQARVSALFVRLRPWARRDVDLQVGRVPTVFGLFGRSGYGTDTPLVNRPLAYAYLLSLRRDALPSEPAELLRMRGRGWLSNFARGNPAPDRGLPLVNTDTWDTGVQVRLANRWWSWAGAVTAGSLATPRVRDDNGAPGLSTRATVRLHPAVTLGASAARGAYLSRTLEAALNDGDDVDRYRQRAVGVDVDASWGRWGARAEALVASFDLPAMGDTPRHAYAVHALWAEGRVRLVPGLDLALRGEHLSFGEVPTAAGNTPWEAPVTRLETGLAFVPRRHVRVKVDIQRNRRPLAGRVRHDTLLAAQVGVWF